MGEEIIISMEARKERVLQALYILTGEAPLINQEERAIISEYRGLCQFGFGKEEIIVISHQMEGINLTKHMKRKDLIISSATT